MEALYRERGWNESHSRHGGGGRIALLAGCRQPYGADHDRAAAHPPALVEMRGETVALLGFNDVPGARDAGSDSAGVALANRVLDYIGDPLPPPPRRILLLGD